MNHYIIVKFLEDYDYISKIEEIKELFNESLALAGVEKIEIFKSNSKLTNRYDLMIKMYLTTEGLKSFDNSWIHAKWKEEYGKYIQNKTIFNKILATNAEQEYANNSFVFALALKIKDTFANRIISTNIQIEKIDTPTKYFLSYKRFIKSELAMIAPNPIGQVIR